MPRNVDTLATKSRLLQALLSRRLAVDDPSQITNLETDDAANLADAPGVYTDTLKGTDRLKVKKPADKVYRRYTK